jgi:glycosyltransferase involved in cell wall biosynthesis
MRIVIDFTQIPRTRTGVGVYADHLVSELPTLLAPDDELFVLIQDDESALRIGAPADPRLHFETISSRIFRNRFALLAYEQIGLPTLLRRLRIDVIHSLHYTFPLFSRAARVVTIHDLTFFLWPQMHTRSRTIVFQPFIRAALGIVEAVVFVSDSTRRDAERLRASSGQVRIVTPLGVAEEAFAQPCEALIRMHLEQLRVGKPYLLFVGTIEPRKNLQLLIEAFDSVAHDFPDVSLVLAGKVGWHSETFDRAIKASKFRDRIRQLGYVDDEQKQALLAGSAALVYPSLYEGFGLPVLEAMALGIPVVTSNVSSLPEVGGDAAMLVDPASPAEIAAAVRNILSDAGLAAQLAKAGPERARAFPWSQTAEKTYAAYCAACRVR